MQFYGTRTILTLLVLGMAVFIGYRVVNHMQTRSQETTSVTLDEQQGADAWIQGFTLPPNSIWIHKMGRKCESGQGL